MQEVTQEDFENLNSMFTELDIPAHWIKSKYQSMLDGDIHFHSTPCPRCGGIIRVFDYNGSGHHKNECFGCASANKVRYALAKIQRTPEWLTEEQHAEMASFYAESARLTYTSTTGTKYVVDHIIPLQGKEVSGLHVPWNLRIITESENASKGNKLLEEFKNPVITIKEE